MNRCAIRCPDPLAGAGDPLAGVGGWLPHEPVQHIAATLERLREIKDRLAPSSSAELIAALGLEAKLGDPIVAAAKLYTFQKPIYRCRHCGSLFQED